MQLKGKKIFITGGGSGIGLGLTGHLSKDNTLIICGRRTDVLEDAKKQFPQLITHACDLEHSEQRQALYEWLAVEHADLNVLINNAGIQHWMNFSDNEFMSKAHKEIAINIEAPMHLTQLCLQLPKLDTIMNVTSGLSFVPLAKVPVYSATKAFFHSFTLSLRHLLAPRGIQVIEIIPPALNTDLGGKGLHDHAPPVSGFIESIFKQLEEGKTELTYGFSENMANAEPEAIREAFARMNGK